MLQMSDHLQNDFWAHDINIPRHVTKLLIFNSHNFHVPLMFKVKQKFWNGPTSQCNDIFLYNDITSICMCNNYSRAVVCGHDNLVLGVHTTCRNFYLKQLTTIPSKPNTLFLYLDRMGHPLPLSELCAMVMHSTSYCQKNYKLCLDELMPDSVWKNVSKRLIHDKITMPPPYLDDVEYNLPLCSGHKH